MDAQHRARFSGPIVVAASGCRTYPPGEAAAMDVLPFLKSPKMYKYMGKQDQLAVVAARLALEGRSLDPDVLRERTGIYLAVGHIPFERDDIEAMARNSVADGHFSMRMFATVGVEQVHPFRTFRCLPNMPIFHISLNCGIQGPYFITYPGVGQFYLALERAVAALRTYEIDYALVGGVADQDNFLVAFDRNRRNGLSQAIAYDAAAFLVLERATNGTGGLELTEMAQTYRSHNPWNNALGHEERFEGCANAAPTSTEPMQACESAGSGCAGPDSINVHDNVFLGAASLPAFLHQARQSSARAAWQHTVSTTDGVQAHSRWTQ